MELVIKIVQFFLCFTILVGIHELGHFLMARAFGIRVEKFYIFFDPWFSLFKWKRGHTEYGIGWLPMGGYVKIAGMIDESMDKSYQEHEPQEWEFRAKPAWQRFLVMIAGVVMNVVLAIVIYCGICYVWGDSYLSNQEARWGYNFNEEAHKLGFRDGDRIAALDGEPVENVLHMVNALLITEGDRRVTVVRDGREETLDLRLDALIAMRQAKGYDDFLTLRVPFLIDSVAFHSAAALQPGDEIVAVDALRGAEYPDYQAYFQAHAGDSVQLTVLRGEREFDLRLPVSEEGRIGVVARTPYTLHTQHYSLWEAIPAGFAKAGRTLASYWKQLKLIVQPKTELYKEVGGFLTIGSIFPGEWNWEGFWMTTAFLSIILAVMNILPITGLDGGHALFTFWEMLTGRKVSDRVLEAAQYVGLAIILFLLLYANGNDIYRLFVK